MPRGFPDILALARLLQGDPPEAQLQTLLTQRPQFLLGHFSRGDDGDVGFITKPRIGNKNADFAVFNLGQGGCTVGLVEIERPGSRLFTKKLTPARTLQTAIGQIQDWHQWLSLNGSVFVHDSIELLETLPEFPSSSSNGSFRVGNSGDLAASWREFGGFDLPIFEFCIVIGRWSKLSKREKDRLLHLNRSNEFRQIQTYDQLVRRAYSRPILWS